MTSESTRPGGSGTGVNRWGAVGFSGGIAGALSALVLLVYPPAVGEEHFSYPFTATGFIVAQLFFSVQHLTMVAVVLVLLRSSAAGSSRLARIGLLIGAGALALLSLLEIGAIAAKDSVAGEPLFYIVRNLYGIPCILTGVGLVLGGVGVLRGGGWQGAKRFLPVILGAYVFVALLPALMGPFWLGRVVIGIWCLLFGLLGWILWRGSQARTAASTSPAAADVAEVRTQL